MKTWLSARDLALVPLIAVAVVLLGLAGRPVASLVVANAAQVQLGRAAVNRDLTAPDDRLFAAALRLWPGNVAALRGLWRSRAVRGQTQAATEVIQAMLAEGRRDDVGAAALGLLKLEAGDRPGALQVWASLGSAQGELAIDLDAASGRTNQAIAVPVFPNQVASVDPPLVRDLAVGGIRAGYNDVWLYLIVGDYYRFETNDPNQALLWYLAARKAYPASFLPPAWAAELLRGVGRNAEARDMYREAFQKSRWPRDDYLMAIGQTYLQEGDLPLAVGAFRQAVALAPRNAEWRLTLGDAYLAAGQAAAARAEYEQARRLGQPAEANAAATRLERLGQ